MIQPFVSQAEWKQATQRTQMLQYEGNKGDAYPYSILLPGHNTSTYSVHFLHFQHSSLSLHTAIPKWLPVVLLSITL